MKMVSMLSLADWSRRHPPLLATSWPRISWERFTLIVNNSPLKCIGLLFPSRLVLFDHHVYVLYIMDCLAVGSDDLIPGTKHLGDRDGHHSTPMLCLCP